MSRLRAPSALLLLVVLGLLLGSAPSEASARDRSSRPEAVAQRYGTGPIEAGDRRWSSAELDLLEGTLGRLTDQERAVLRGVRFIRKRRGARPGHAGLYRTDRRGSRIYVFDLAFDGQSGRGRRPNATIGHEIGHAVCFWELRVADRRAREAVDRFNDAVDAYNALVRRHNRSGGSARERLREQIERERAELGGLEEAARRAKRRQRRVARSLRSAWPREGVLADYRRALDGMRGPTRYGRRNLRESFAESFDLFHRDRAQLKRVLPKVHDWFLEGGHLRHLP